MSADFINRVKMHEGFRDKPYYCSEGKLTIGYGWNLETTPLPEWIAEIILKDQLQKCANLMAAHSPSIWAQLTPARQEVLTEMCFQLGYNGVLKFQKMWAALKRGDYAEAGHQMRDSLWYVQTMNRAEYLARIMENG